MVHVGIQPAEEHEFDLYIRVPSWSSSPSLEKPATASGYDPRTAHYRIIRRTWKPDGETVEFNFDVSVQLRRAHSRVRGHTGKVAVTRGPLVYCLESTDHPDVDIFTAQLDPASLREEFVPDLLGGCVVIYAGTIDGRPLKFIPYFLWANRGESQMTVWVHSAET
jgi:DUF1680 family protein